MKKFDAKLNHLCDVDAYAHFPYNIGESSNGMRFIYPGAEGGRIEGERFSGKILNTGGDWARIRPDRGFELDVRLIIEPDSEASKAEQEKQLIYVTYKGIIDMTQEHIDMFMAGTVPQGLVLYVNPIFETVNPDYAWLCKAFVVGKGESIMTEKGFNVKYSWYTLN